MYIAEETVRRLPRYLSALEALRSDGQSRVSSLLLADRVHESAVKIRYDLRTIGSFGQKGLGYDADELHHELVRFLGADRPFSAVLIGGNGLERTLLQDRFFAELIRKVFLLPCRSGPGTREKAEQVLAEAASFMEWEHTDIGILAVPASCARRSAEYLKNAGVRGVLNLTGVDLVGENAGLMESLDLEDSLLCLSCRLREMEQDMPEHAGMDPDQV